MPISSLLMLLAAVLTLALPAVLASTAGDTRVRWHLTALVLGLLLQIAGETAILSMGHKAWLPYWEAPLVLLRIGQLGVLFWLGKKIEVNRKRSALLFTVGMNFVLWFVVAYRLIGRFH